MHHPVYWLPRSAYTLYTGRDPEAAFYWVAVTLGCCCCRVEYLRRGPANLSPRWSFVLIPTRFTADGKAFKSYLR